MNDTIVTYIGYTKEKRRLSRFIWTNFSLILPRNHNTVSTFPPPCAGRIMAVAHIKCFSLHGGDLEFQSFPRLEKPHSSIPVFLRLVVIPSMIDCKHQSLIRSGRRLYYANQPSPHSLAEKWRHAFYSFMAFFPPLCFCVHLHAISGPKLIGDLPFK